MKIFAMRATAWLSVALPLLGIAPARAADDPQQVIELRQYKIVPAKRDAFVTLFESRFVESQEELGMRLIGQFRDRSDPNRFTWIRGFPSMEARGKSLNDFYFGPIWRANRTAANALLDDNDDVLLLRPAWPGAAFAPASGSRPAAGAALPSAGLVVATIEYLWKDPAAGYAAYFRDHIAPAYRAAGLPVLGAYVAEDEPNNFPRLYVRQGERVLVWFTRMSEMAAYKAAQRRLTMPHTWRTSLWPAIQAYRERTPQILLLSPTPRSLLR